MTEWLDGVWMPLTAAKICMNCEAIHNSAQCPSCTSKTYRMLSTFLNREENDVTQYSQTRE